ncbi:hypothetical protein GALMADRAFT_24757, partial [Galerina marginata CBS 339.88]
SARRRLYRTVADESTEIQTHINELRSIQEELHLLGTLVSDEDFTTILISSLPESWDQFTTAYLGASTSSASAATATTPTSTSLWKITSFQLVALILEENRRRTERSGLGANVAMQAHTSKPSAHGKTPVNKSNLECTNCHKKGHTHPDCWSEGGGSEGKGPRSNRPRKGGKSKPKGKERASQAQSEGTTTTDEKEAAYQSKDGQPSVKITRNSWIADTAATSHICNDRELFKSYIPLTSKSIEGIGQQSISALGIGKVSLNCNVNGKLITNHLQNVLYAPNAANNLLSIIKLDKADGYATCKGGGIKLWNKNDKLLAQGKIVNNLYVLDAEPIHAAREHAQVALSLPDTWDSLHKKYGHLSISGLKKLIRDNLIEGLTVDSTEEFHQCEACIQGKQHHKSFPAESETRAKNPGELTHSDVWGPARETSIQGSKYYISFTDDAVRRCTVLFMKKKSEAYEKVKEYMTWIEKKFGFTPKLVRVDNGTEYINQKTKDWCAEKGIEIQTTAPYSPSQNGVAERFNRTLMEMARSMLIGRNLPRFLWAEAVRHAAYLRNRSPTRALNGKTPEEAWSGRKPNMSHLQEFGCDVWILNEGSQSKLAPKSTKHTFVGFEDGPKAVRYYDSKTRNIKVSRNYIFSEKEPEAIEFELVPRLELEGELKGNSEPQSPEKTPKSPASKSKINNPDARLPAPRPRNEGTSQDEIDEEIIANLASNELGFVASLNNANDDLPQSINEAKASPEWEHWEKAINEEYSLLEGMETWELDDLPPERKAIGCRWVFLRKYNENGEIIRYKARLVAQGFSQIPGMDFDGTFAPVMRHDSLRALLAIAAIKNLEIQQLDVKGAYLNGDLREEIFMRQPDGFHDGTSKVCRLKKTLYGLKQSGREWNRKLDKVLTELRFSKSNVDHCVYIRTENGHTSYITVWVDDLMIFTDKSDEMNEIKAYLKKEFEISDLGEPKLIIGLEVKRDRKKHTISLGQTSYVDRILKKYGMENCRPVSTPMDPNVVLTRVNENDVKDEPREDRDERLGGRYAAAVGSLMYAAIGTRPDIAYAVQKLSKYSSNPGNSHWTALKRVFRYLAGTRDRVLFYGGDVDEDEVIFSAYCDADFASDSDDRKSISGYTLFLGNAAIAWSSKKQTTIALSTTEAEYTAIAHATRQIIWLRNLFQDLGYTQNDPTILFSDNQSAIALTQDPQFHARSKHFDITNHFVRAKVYDQTIEVIYCPTDEMTSDIFTKALAKPKHEQFTSELGLLPA